MSNVQHFKRQIRRLELEMDALNPRDPIEACHLRGLADDHAVYRDCLRREGIIVPIPLVKW